MKNNTITKKGQRKYADAQSTLFTHPTRMKILAQLETGKKTTTELEKLTGENRVNLYHHLNLLENELLIISEKSNRQKYFQLNSKSNDKILQDSENVILSIKLENKPLKKEKVFQLLNKLLDESESKIPPIKEFDKNLFSLKRIILEFD